MTASIVRLALLAGLLLFLFFGEMPERSRFWSAFFDAGHTVLFGVIAVLIRGLLERAGVRPASGVRISMLAFAWTVILGAATELLQMLQRHGDPSVADLLRDTAGAAAFLLIAGAVGSRLASRSEPNADGGTMAGRRPPRRLLFWAALVVSSILLLAAGRTLIVTGAAYVARNRAFPTLFRLDGSWWEREFIDVQQNELIAAAPVSFPVAGGTETALLARLDLRPARYSGITFREPYPDWRRYHRLVLTIVSDLGAPLRMAIRVHDAAHDQRYRDRFNKGLTIQPGRNVIAIPLEDIRRAPDRRAMDLGHVRGVMLFASGLARRTHIYLGPISLE